MFYEMMERLLNHANQLGKTEVADELAGMLDREMDLAANMTRLCPDVDSLMHEIEKNLQADELAWRHYSGDGNQRQMTVTEVVGDNHSPDYIYKLQQDGWNREQIDIIIQLTIGKYCNE